MRTVHCQPTDPVSFALIAGAQFARFPNVPGWSIADTARRAVAEHAAWLAVDARERSGTVLGRLAIAARAGLLQESVGEAEPELALTIDATLESLAERTPSAAPVAAAAREAYHRFAEDRAEPPATLTAALRRTVLALPAYVSAEPISARA
jgi:hypothetical protein